MELKKGYIQTEIGVIPKDWDLISYGTAFNFLSTASYSRDELSDNHDILYVHYGDIHTKLNYFLNVREINLPSISNDKTKNYSLIKNGDVIMADASEDYEGIGKSVEVKNIESHKAISGLHTFLLRDKKQYFVDGFKGYLHSNKLIKDQFDRLATGLKVYGVSKNNLKIVLIPLPPKPEQEKIATALSATDALINSLEKLIAKKKAIRLGAMQRLLRPKKGWRITKLSEIGKVIRGASPRPQGDKRYYGGNVPRLMVEDVTRDGKFVTPKVDFLTEEGAKRSRPCKKGTLTIVCSGTVGIPSILDVDACIHDGFLALVDIKKDFSIDFLYHQLSTLQSKLENSATHGGIFTNLTTSVIKDFEINLPKKEEQIAISKILSDLDIEVDQIQQKLNKYKQIKQGMMQSLLTGKIRFMN